MAQTVAAVAMAANALAPQRAADSLLSNLQIFGQGVEQPRPALASAPSGVRQLMDRAEASVLQEPQPDTSVIAAGAPATGAASSGQSSLPEPLPLEDVSRDDGLEAQMPDVTNVLDASGVTALPEAPPSVAESIRRLANAHYGKDLPAEPEEGQSPQPPKKRGRPPGQPSMKRPAAHQVAGTDTETAGLGGSTMKVPAGRAACEGESARDASLAATMKRPASKASSKGASATVESSAKSVKGAARTASSRVGTAATAKSRSVAQPVLKKPAIVKKLKTVTQKQRHKERPTGCPTCRHTPGCCPSCWRKRGFKLL